MTSYNKEKYIRQQEETKESLSRMVEEMAKNYQDNPEDLVELLKFRSRFHTYSFRNTVLICKQNPGASFVASYQKFQEMGYQVQKGQKGMKIFVPVLVNYFMDLQTEERVQLKYASLQQKEKIKEGKIKLQQSIVYKIGHVFDISQTDCPERDYPKFYHMGYPDNLHAALCRAIREYCSQILHCPVYRKEMNSIILRGYYLPQKNEIFLNSKLEDTERLSTLIHEMGHAILHQNTPENALVSQIEFEADSLALMLENHLGIETSLLRKKHLSEHYQVLAGAFKQSGQELQLEPILNHVFSQYADCIPILESIIDKSLSREPDIQENHIPLSQKEELWNMQTQFNFSHSHQERDMGYLREEEELEL